MDPRTAFAPPPGSNPWQGNGVPQQAGPYAQQFAQQFYHDPANQGVYFPGGSPGGKAVYPEENGHTTDEDFTTKVRTVGNRHIHCLICLAVSVVLLILYHVVLTTMFDSAVKEEVQRKGSQLLGTNVTVQEVRMNPFLGKASMRAFKVADPPGYPSNIVVMNGFVFDVGPISLIWGYLSNYDHPVYIRNMTIDGCDTSLYMKSLTGGSNVKTVLNHMNNQSTHDPNKKSKMQAKIKVEYFQLSDTRVTWQLHPLKPESFEIRDIIIRDVGMKGNGVTVKHFMEIVARTVLESVIKAAPGKAAAKFAGAFGVNISEPMDYAEAEYDKVADGQDGKELKNFDGWVHKEADSLLDDATGGGGESVAEEASVFSEAKAEFTSFKNKVEEALGIKP